MSKKQNAVPNKSDKKANAGKCSSCGKDSIYSKGLCQQCYKAQWYQEKKASAPIDPDKKPVGRPPISGVKATECYACGEPKIYARGLCYKCYKRAYQQGRVTKEGIDASYVRPRTIDPATGKKKICSYCGINPVYANDLCRNCNTRANRNGGDPSYRGRSYERALKSEQLLNKRRKLQESEDEKDE